MILSLESEHRYIQIAILQVQHVTLFPSAVRSRVERKLEDLKKLRKVTLKGGQQNFNSQRNPAVPDSPHKSSGRAGERPPYNVQGHKSFFSLSSSSGILASSLLPLSSLLPHSSILPPFSLLPHSGLSPVAL